MKKLFAVMLALCLLGSFALAEDAAEVSWADVKDAVAEVPGDFKTIEDAGLMVWVPDQLQAQELTDEDLAKNIVAKFAAADGDNAKLDVVVGEAGMTLEEYTAELQASGKCTEIAPLVINEMPAVRYHMPEDDSLCIAFGTEDGYIIEFTMSPLSVEGAAAVWTIVTASIQIAE